MAMSQTQMLMAALLVQQGLCAGIWLIAAQLKLGRASALHWATATGLIAVTIGLVLQRDAGTSMWIVAAQNIMLMAGLVVLRRGVEVFLKNTPRDAEHALVIGLHASLAGLISWLDAPVREMALLGSAIGAWILWRMAYEIFQGTSVEVHRKAAIWCTVPAATIGAVFAVRAVFLLVSTNETKGYLTEDNTSHLVAAMSMMVYGFVMNALMLAMTVLRLVHRLKHQSEHDALTDLLNRRAMTQLIETEDRRRQQPGAGFALLSADIDHFKRINDQFGHAVGDEVLRRVAQAMRQACRPTDRVGRVGGEEFLVLLPGAPRSMVSSISERLVSAVRRLEFADVAPGLRVTISVGVAMADGVMEPVDLLLKRVDRALYEAKHAGRDRIVQAAAAV